MIYRPIRERPVDETLDALDEMLAEHRLRRAGAGLAEQQRLQPASRRSWPALRGALRARSKLAISLPSLRIDSFSVAPGRDDPAGRKTGFTFAPEAGSQRLRDVINKGVTEEDLLRTAEAAFAQRLEPHQALFHARPAHRDRRGHAGASPTWSRKVLRAGAASARAPRSRSTSAWPPLCPSRTRPSSGCRWPTWRWSKRARRGCAARCAAPTIKLSWHGTEATWLEAVLCRGDRRLGAVIERAWRAGARFDAWNEYFDYRLWQEAFAAEGLDPLFYSSRAARPRRGLALGSHLCGVDREYLWAEYQRALRGETTPDCRGGCAGVRRAPQFCAGGLPAGIGESR